MRHIFVRTTFRIIALLIAVSFPVMTGGTSQALAADEILTGCDLGMQCGSGAGIYSFSAQVYDGHAAAGSTLTITVNQAGGSGSNGGTVQYATADGSATVSGSDYTATSGTLSFASDDATKTFTIAIGGSPHAGTHFSISLSNPSAGTSLGTPSTAYVTFNSDSSLPVVTSTTSSTVSYSLSTTSSYFGLGTTSYSTAENAGSMLITVNGSPVAFPNNAENPLNSSRFGDGTCTVQYATVDGTAKAGVNYVATSGTLDFVSGNSGAVTHGGGVATKLITVPLLDDAVITDGLTFTIALSAPSCKTVATSQETSLSRSEIKVGSVLLAININTNTNTNTNYATDHIDTTLQAATISLANADSLPAAPTNLVGTAESSSSIALSWTNNAGSNVTSYSVERATAITGPFTDIDPPVTTFTDTNLAAGTTYYYRVKAINGVGSSSYTDTISVTTKAAGSATTLPEAGVNRLSSQLPVSAAILLIASLGLIGEEVWRRRLR